MNADVIFETTRLTFRRFTDTDADAELLFELDSDPDVMRYIGPFGLPSAPACRERVRTAWLPYHAHPRRGFFALSEKAGGGFVGWFFLRPSPDFKFAAEAGWARPADLELGYRLRRAAWGRGLATEAATALVREAFTDPDVASVVAAALQPNRASRRVMEKVGMTHARDVTVAGFAAPLAVYALGRNDVPHPESDA